MIVAKIETGNRFGGLWSYEYIQEDWIYTNVLPTESQLRYIRMSWNGSEWVDSATQEEIDEYNSRLIPLCISRRQFFTQLFIDGINEQDIVDVIKQLPPIDNSLALIAFREAATFERNSPLLVVVGQMLGLTESDIDTIFLNASSL